jgi:hypothetical protein
MKIAIFATENQLEKYLREYTYEKMYKMFIA